MKPPYPILLTPTARVRLTTLAAGYLLTAAGSVQQDARVRLAMDVTSPEIEMVHERITQKKFYLTTAYIRPVAGEAASWRTKETPATQKAESIATLEKIIRKCTSIHPCR